MGNPMQNHDDDNIDEKPLDPVMEKVRRKMVRLLGVSLGVMFIGVMAVLAAVVYKIRSGDDAEVPLEKVQMMSAVNFAEKMDVILPLGFKVDGFNLDGARGAIHGKGSDGISRILLVDLTNGEVISTLTLRN